MPARLSAFVIWALVAASAVFWGMRVVARAPAAPTHTVAAGDVGPQRADLTRLFGAPMVEAAPVAEAPAPAPSRFQLTGVMAPRRPGGEGIALIAVDGKTPRAYRVGAPIDDELVIKSVSHRSVALGPAQGDASVVLEMPPLPVAATGTLPPPGAAPPGGPLTPPAAGAVPAIALPSTPAAPVAPGVAPNVPGRFPTPETARGRSPRDRLPPSSTE